MKERRESGDYSGEVNSKYKGPKAGASLEWIRNSKRPVGLEWSEEEQRRGQGAGDIRSYSPWQGAGVY